MDKAALGSKVSCAHFDASMERLEERLRELLRRVSGQEQRWQEAQQRFSDALDSKVRGTYPHSTKLAPWGLGSLRQHPSEVYPSAGFSLGPTMFHPGAAG